GYRNTPSPLTRNDVNLEPRFGVRFVPSAKDRSWTLKAALGLYHQPPLAQDLSRIFGNPYIAVQRAIHYVFGIEKRLGNYVDLDLQFFYKDLGDLTVRSLQAAPPLESVGVGRAYGGQFLLRHRFNGRLFGWVAYTYSRSERRDHPGDDWRPFDF